MVFATDDREAANIPRAQLETSGQLPFVLSPVPIPSNLRAFL